MSLRAVANESKSVILEVVLELGEGPVTSLVDDLLSASKVQGLDTANSGLYKELMGVLNYSWHTLYLNGGLPG